VRLLWEGDDTGDGRRRPWLTFLKWLAILVAAGAVLVAVVDGLLVDIAAVVGRLRP
jgi:hypothetical protein